MPQLVTYRSRPVKRRRQVPGGLLLIFYAAERGQPGPTLVVTDDEWRRHGRVSYFASGTLPEVRASASDRA